MTSKTSLIKSLVALALVSSSGLAFSHTVDLTKLPLGDGKISTSPKAGYAWSCSQTATGGGATVNGSWIDLTNKTWNYNRKLVVQGNVTWPNATYSTSVANTSRSLKGNGLPVGHGTGIYPISPTDPAYAVDRNPNSISAQSVNIYIPKNPTLATNASCVPMGMIGVMNDGTALFNSLDAMNRDAPAHEVQDMCDGHPERTGMYHYHNAARCVPGMDKPNTLVGYALDGFGIFSPYDENGNELSNSDLDECHGRTSKIMWDGKEVVMYHYVMTHEYPYSIGCFKGVRGQGAGTPPSAPPTTSPKPPVSTVGTPPAKPTAPQPPAFAVAACAGKTVGTSCSIKTPVGATLQGTCRTPPGLTVVACIPAR